MIGLLVLFWYGLVPIAGALVSRYGWRRFRDHFNRLCLAPLLDYAAYVNCGQAPSVPPPAARQKALPWQVPAGKGPAPTLFRLAGSFESITDGHTLWVRTPDLTIPVALTGAQVYMLPTEEQGERGGFDLTEETPQRLRRDQVATLTGEVRVFVGGALSPQDGRWTFAVTPESPLQVIFYTGDDRSMAARVIRTGRHRNEYWNGVTPYALVLGALCLIVMAVAFLPRPAFRLTVITAFCAAFVPLYTLAPPGLLLTIAYRRLWQGARMYRSFRDLVRLPLIYASGRLPDGESYGARCYRDLPPGIPLLTPGMEKPKRERWHVFGVLDSGPQAAGAPLPREPRDSFATFGAIPGEPERLARACNSRAYLLAVLSWFLLLAGIGLNAFLIARIVILLSTQA
ncbi:MAG: hypothetical protein LBU00_05025 [Treponema sp.]|nr:hypothetical protein [Treponema sp.]